MSYLEAVRLINRNAWKLMWVSVMVGFCYFGIYAVVFNLYLLRMGYGAEFVGVLNGTAFLVSALCAIPAGMVGRRWGLRRGFLSGYLLWVVASILLPLTEWIPVTLRTAWLLVAFAIAWTGAILFLVNRTPYLIGLTSEHERPHVFSIDVAINRIAAVAGSLVAGFLPGLLAGWLGASLDTPVPYRLTLYVPPLLYLLILPALWSLQEVHAPRVQRTGTPQRAPMALLLAIALFIMLVVTAEGAVTTFFNVYMDSGLHVSTATIGILIAAGQLVAIPAALAAPLLVKRWGSFRTLLGVASGLVLATLLLAATPHWMMAGLGFVGSAALVSILQPMRTIYHQEVVAAEWRSTMSGVAIMAARVGQAAMVGAGGFLIAGLGYRSTFTVAALLTFAGALFFWGYFRLRSGVPAKPPAIEPTPG
jgi:MFS family permease